jgi:hypothetical protein
MCNTNKKHVKKNCPCRCVPVIQGVVEHLFHLTPSAKIVATREYGATVVLEGTTYDDAFYAVKKICC